MKPFFALDTTNKSEKLTLNGAEFKVQEVPAELFQKYKKAIEKNRELKAEAELPRILKVVQVFFGLGSALSLYSAFMTFFDKEEAAAAAADNQNYIDMLFAVLFCSIICGAIHWYGNYRKKKMLESYETKKNNLLISSTVKEMEEYLKVPENSILTEILVFVYKVRDGKLEINADKEGRKNADNCKFKMYKENGSLILCALDKKFAFPFDSIKELKKVKEELYLSYWHKTKPYNSEDYKEYKLKLDGGKVIINEYLSLILSVDNGGEKTDWAINFPIYEIKTVEEITNLKAE